MGRVYGWISGEPITENYEIKEIDTFWQKKMHGGVNFFGFCSLHVVIGV